MTNPALRRLAIVTPFLTLALFTQGADRKSVIALANKVFPSVMNRREPARFLVMVFDSTERFLWGFPVKGGITINVRSDTLTSQDRMAIRAGGKPAPSTGERTRHAYTTSTPAFFRDSTRALHTLPMNTDDGLLPTNSRSDESGIEGVLASEVVGVDHFALYPNDDPPLQFDVVAVHLLGVRADTARPVRTRIPLALIPLPPKPAALPATKKARVKSLVILPVPVPEVARPYDMEACFDVAPTGDAKLLTWTRSRDLDYNTQVRKALERYQFWPATLDGVAVRDTLCVRAKTTVPRGG